MWLQHLRETFGEFDEPESIVEYVRWWFRRALTGDAAGAEAMLFLFGVGGTGKSTIAETMLRIAGGYGAVVQAEHVTGENNTHLSWLARLDRKRFVLMNELDEKRGWRTPVLLSLISGEVLTANHMRQNPFEFRSRAAVCVTGNHAPHAPASSGYWRRCRQIDCRHRPSAPDDRKARMPAEDGRILAWALDAPMDEPTVPYEMTRSAAAMRDEQNPVADWINATWVKDPKGFTSNTAAWNHYMKAGPGPAVTETEFKAAMRAAFADARQNKARGRRCSFAPGTLLF